MGEPVLASHRLVRVLVLQQCGKDKVSPTPEEVEAICSVFLKYGGSWYSLYAGSVDQISKLKKVIKVAFDLDRISKNPEWSART